MTRQPERGPSPAEIADQIENEIRNGTRAPGSRLRSRSALADDFGVSLSTIYSAVERLKDRGMVYGEQGRAVYVAEPTSWRVIPLPASEDPPPAQ